MQVNGVPFVSKENSDILNKYLLVRLQIQNLHFHGKPWPFVLGTDLTSILEIENVSCLKETKAELEKQIKEVARPRLRKGETDTIFQSFRVKLEFP